MTKLVSILMPTRSASHKSLRQAVDSIRESAGQHAKHVEILMRADDDDKDRHELISELADGWIIGPRGRGYIDMGIFVNELAEMSRGSWCWLFDDDAWIEGDWVSQLAALPCDPEHGPAVNAETYALGPSRYANGPRGGAPGLIMPTAFVKQLNHVNPVDQQWLDEVHHRGWTIRQLAGVTYHHDGRAR